MKVAQSWDDGVVDDVSLTELLRRHNATATFNLNPGLHPLQRAYSWTYGTKEVWRLGQDELAAVYAGFEIANHSLTHLHLPNLSPVDLAREVSESRRVLQAWFQQPVRGFCYPFGTFNAAVKEAIRAAGHIYARTITESARVVPASDPLELSVSCRFNDPSFWAHYEQAKASDSLFLFWGHSYELVNEAMWAELEHKIAGISADPAAEWVNLESVFSA